MCGITGWLSYEQDVRAHHSVVEAMTDTLVKRGPDAGGVWLDRHIGLGHRRLAVIDLSGGAQPMLAVAEGSAKICLVFNGEIYNFV